MCGLIGEWGGADADSVRGMMDTLAHRGPDDEGVFVPPGGGGMLGHRRLSIMDPQGGHQPILDETGRRAIAANGEIYNFRRLEGELEWDHQFQTSSDTEAILHLYEESGPAVVDRLDGMYAFAILGEDGMFVARDPLGIKPLYQGRRNGSLVFASELKAMAGCTDVREFPPGTSFHSTLGFRTFYRVPRRAPEEASVATWVQRIADTMEACVEKRLMSDVPVGAFLSGGLDSSIIVALARRHLPELHTFSVGMEGSGDLRAARVVADHLGTIHHEYALTREEIAATLPEIVFFLESFDQDLVRSAIPTWFTSRLAARQVQVILTGEGADELFAGYTYHKEVRDPEVLREELHRSVTALHNLNLQRVDRMTMAHSIEGRVPFLDREMIDLGQRIPVELKLRSGTEKWILRKAFEDLLPYDIVWRKKEQFDEGSGVTDVVGEIAAEQISEAEADAHRAAHPGVRLRSREECHYHRLLLEGFDDPAPVLANVAHWAERPAGIA